MGKSLDFRLPAGGLNREFGPRTNSHLRVDAGQVRLDRLHAHEQVARDLFVGLALSDETRDTSLGRAELIGSRGATVNPMQLIVRASGPSCGAEIREYSGCSFECFPCEALLASSSSDVAGDQKRAAQLEWIGQPFVFRQPFINCTQSRRKVALRGRQLAAAARPGRLGPGSVEISGLFFERVDEGFGRLEVTEGDQRLDLVRKAVKQSRFRISAGALTLHHRSKPSMCGLR